MNIERIYKVVVNEEEQYSIWPIYKENAPGWKDVGKSGSKQICLNYISEHWKDLTPRSVRNYHRTEELLKK